MSNFTFLNVFMYISAIHDHVYVVITEMSYIQYTHMLLLKLITIISAWTNQIQELNSVVV